MALPAKHTPSELAELAHAAMRLGLRNSAAELVDAAYRVLGGEEADDVALTLSEIKSVGGATGHNPSLTQQQREDLQVMLGIAPSVGLIYGIDSVYAKINRYVVDAERHVARLTAVVSRLERTRSFTAWKTGESLLETMTETLRIVRTVRDTVSQAVTQLASASDDR